METEDSIKAEPKEASQLSTASSTPVPPPALGQCIEFP